MFRNATFLYCRFMNVAFLNFGASAQGCYQGLGRL
jgi:hypothetical protein